jgi:gluconate 2-dehydrogenase gamma chain
MPLTRRRFLQSSGIVALAPVAGTVVANPPNHAATEPATRVQAKPAYQFFRVDESPFIEAAAERLIPPDDVGPSALEAGVPGYIDAQLAGAWGAGERLYRSGPWQPGAPTQGYQLPFTPAELFRTALRGVRADLAEAGRAPFEELAGAEQDAYLTLLQTTPRDLAGVPGNIFFESLLGMTIEGYFSDPVYGGNLDMAAWKMIGFPGAYGAYYDLVDKHGVRFQGEPRSLGQNGRGTIRIVPSIPAGPAHTDPHMHPGPMPKRS